MPTSTGARTNINIRVDSEVKNKALEVFSALGLDMTSNVYYDKRRQHNKIRQLFQKSNPKKQS